MTGGAFHIQVAAFVPVSSTFTYLVPAELADAVQVGSRVLVPFGRKRVVGVVVALDVRPPGLDVTRIKPIHDLLDAEPVVEPGLLKLLLWMATYYYASPGEAIRLALPAALHTREKQVFRLTAAGARALDAQDAVLRSADDDLSPGELTILRRLAAASGPISLRSLQHEGRVGRALPCLVSRGLVAQSVRRSGQGKFRTDLLLELVEPVDMSSLARARRQQKVVEALRARGGRGPLASLELPFSGGRAVVRRLAAMGVLRLEEVEVPRDPFDAEPIEAEREIHLNEDQARALEALEAATDAGRYRAFLLHGVTSSGKTEVYLRLIARVFERGRTAIVLVPEISLTPQLAGRFRSRFGDQVAVLHSGLTAAERYGQWRLIRSSKVKIVVGARSAIFAPLESLGVVIVDEEHDPSFKQEEGVRYNARDLALVRAKRVGAVAVLGTATPSMESFFGAHNGRLDLLEMPRRATPRPLPRVEIVDLRVHMAGPEGILSHPMARALGEVLDRGEQAILFINRRGFSTFVMCKACGLVLRCKNCSVSLTHHRKQQRLLCHYCGFGIGVPDRCPDCHAESIELLGLGTEQVEHHVACRFPNARVARLDRDTAAGRGLRSILSRVGQREVDVLVGTQMVTKGHDFPHVTLVGVICADLGLHFPDFRASERTFQLLTQVAGRAGRGERGGQVLVQTYDPEHPSLRHARSHDYESFYDEEVLARQELSYPPCGHLAAVRIDGENPDAVADTARELAQLARSSAADAGRGVDVLGPAEAPIQRLKGRTRWLLLLKGRSRDAVRRVLGVIALQPPRARGGRLRVSVDVDPLMML